MQRIIQSKLFQPLAGSHRRRVDPVGAGGDLCVVGVYGRADRPTGRLWLFCVAGGLDLLGRPGDLRHRDDLRRQMAGEGRPDESWPCPAGWCWARDTSSADCSAVRSGASCSSSVSSAGRASAWPTWCRLPWAIKWFPDKKGVITGLAVAGFGFGATVWVKLADSWFGGLLNTTAVLGLPPVQSVFVIYGVAFAALVLLGSLVMVNPPGDYRADRLDATRGEQRQRPSGACRSYSAARCCARRSFTCCGPCSAARHWRG